MKLKLAFSPCPNDTFIFDALVNKKIDTEGLDFEVYLEDVQTLNEWAAKGMMDITKLSFPALLFNNDKYRILTSGAALGKGVGPLLIAKRMVDVPDMEHCTVAIPGEHTTANFLLQFALPQIRNKVPMLFSEIENAVIHGNVDLGVIIHENRFTYHQKGLIKIMDLGEVWETRTGFPIPLGCIAAKRELPLQVIRKADELIRRSLLHAFHNYPDISDYVKDHAQEMDEKVMRQHIELYVNDFTTDLGEEGKKAIEAFSNAFSEQKGLKQEDVFN